MQMWGDSTGAPLVAQHLGFGIGALLAPQLANVFIYEDLDTTTEAPNNTQFVMSSDYRYSESTPILTTQETGDSPVDEIEIAYFISAMISLVFAVIFMIFYIFDKKERAISRMKEIVPKEEKRNVNSYIEILSPASCAEGYLCFGSVFFILLFILFIHTVGGERAYSKYLYIYVTEGDYNFSSSKAADLNSLFWLFFTIGRALTLVASHFMNPTFLMIIVVIFNVINGTVLAAVGNHSEIILWVFSASYGMFLSPVFPTALVWANTYVEMTAIAVSVPYVGSAVGGMVYQYVTGFLFDKYGEFTLLYVILGYTVNLAVAYVVLQLVASRHGKRHNTGNRNAQANRCVGKEDQEGHYVKCTTEF